MFSPRCHEIGVLGEKEARLGDVLGFAYTAHRVLEPVALVIILVLLVLGGGGYYGRRRWF